MIEELPHRSGADSISRRSAIRALAMGSVALCALVGIPGTANALAQEGWRWCRKCQVMFFALDRAGGLGICPAGGRHDPSTSDYYYLRMEPEIAGVQQGGWRWCRKCMGMFYGRGGGGVCPDDRNPHDGSASLHYAQLT